MKIMEHQVDSINSLIERLGMAPITDVEDITYAHADLIIKAMTMSLDNEVDWPDNLITLLQDYMDVITFYTRIVESQKPKEEVKEPSRIISSSGGVDALAGLRIIE